MIRLNLPPFDIQLEQRADKIYVWDVLRNKSIRLTPEEWVRQHFVHYLIEHLGYPKGLLMNEVSLEVGGVKRRSDTVLYTRQLAPQMIIEYKAPDISLSERVLNQILRYNFSLRVPFLILSNGLEHTAYHIDYEHQTYETLQAIPHYTEL